jgi:hypothetical protein
MADLYIAMSIDNGENGLLEMVQDLATADAAIQAYGAVFESYYQ